MLSAAWKGAQYKKKCYASFRQVPLKAVDHAQTDLWDAP